MELVSPTSKQKQHGGAAGGKDEDTSKEAHAGSNLSDIYKALCAELHCKVNSAVATQLNEHMSVRSLTELHLADNYVGPKGVVPIIRLMHLCQGLKVIDLRGNGLNNKSVALLSETLWNHCGIERILLGNNPVSLDGGKRLLELVEHNDRITDVDLAGTDIFASLVDRIAMAAQRNRTNVPTGTVHIGDVDKGASQSQSGLPRLSALQNDVHRQLMNAPRVPASAKTESTPVIVPLDSSNRALLAASQRAESSAADGFGALESADDGRAGTRISFSKPLQPPPSKSAEESRTGISYEELHRSPMKQSNNPHAQRPPIPAIASMENSRLTETQRAALREKFAERAKLFKSSGLTEANKAADRARAELWLLERGVGKTKPVKEKDWDGTKPSNGTSSPSTATTPRLEGKAATQDGTAPTGTLASTEQGVPATAVTAPHSAPVVLESEHKAIETPEAAEDAQAKSALAKASYTSAGGDASALIRALAERSSSGGAEMASSWSGSFNTPALTSEERFKRLFDAGCREYALKNADAAYMAWNEAMEIAVRKPNREWIAILTTNLQRLSYELLVAEGTQQLEKQNLEQADHVFNLALNLAKKARNAEWEAEMTRAQRAVQRSVFQVRQEAASALFERARALPDEKITDNDVFVVPGTDSLTPHTEAFVNEWSRMLLVKEAVDTWSEALRVASRVGAQLGKPLQKEVHDSMDRVTEFLVSRLLIPEPINHTFSLQKTHKYIAHEINSLIDLWKNMYASAHFKICHSQFDAISSLQLGNLYLASNQLAAAQRWFELAAESGDQLFVACANTYLGIVFWQRANYATAEQRFYTGLEMLTQLSKGQYTVMTTETSTGMGTTLLNESDITVSTQEVDPQSSPQQQQQQQQQRDSNWTESTLMQDGLSKNASSAERNRDAALQKKNPNIDVMKTRRLVEVLSRAFIVNMRARCFKFLVSTFAFSYRYRESLEVHERGLIERYQDSLTDQMALNFSTQPTLDHLVAIAEADQTPLVYFETAYRFKWNDALQRFDVEETLFTWVVPPQAEMRYVQVNLTEDFHVTSLQDAVRDVRRGLRVDPLGSNGEGSRDGIVTELHTTAWMAPLKLLYTILFQPVMDFIRALDSSFITDSGLLTIIPTDCLWALPFHALIFPNGKFLVEEVAVQFAFCATQTAFTQISSMRSSGMQRQRGVIVVQTDEDTWDPTQPAQNEVDFPFDSIRSVKEGERLRQVAQSTKRQTGEGIPSEQADASNLDSPRGDTEAHRANASAMDNDVGEYFPLPHAGGMASSVMSKSEKSATHRQSSLKSSLLAPSPPPVPARGDGLRDWTQSPRGSRVNIGGERNDFENNSASSFIVTDDLDTVRSVLPLSRTLHFATACDPIVENSDGSTGALCITTAQQKVGLLRASEIAQTQMYTSMVVMSQTNVRTHRTSLITDGVLCLTRSFFAAGAVSVIFSQWCTPDMIPADFFCLLYEQLTQLDDPLQSQQSRANGTRSAVREVVDAARLATAKAAAMNRAFFGVGTTRGNDLNLDDYKNTNSVQRTKGFSDDDSGPRAVPLARVVALVVRKMLGEGTNRYNPQRWAGYYFAGSQPMNPASIREAPRRLRR